MTFLAAALGFKLDRPVLDRTGLTDSFDMELRYSPGGPRPVGPFEADAALTSPLPPPTVDLGWPPLDEALRDQLGLRLEPTRGPVEVLVIDSVQPLTEN